MADTVFTWIILCAAGVAVIFCALIVQDLWHQRRRKHNANTKPVRISHRFRRAWRPIARGYDYPELLLEDMEVRTVKFPPFFGQVVKLEF